MLQPCARVVRPQIAVTPRCMTLAVVKTRGVMQDGMHASLAALTQQDVTAVAGLSSSVLSPPRRVPAGCEPHGMLALTPTRGKRGRPASPLDDSVFEPIKWSTF